MIEPAKDRIFNAVFAAERKIRDNGGYYRIAPFIDRILTDVNDSEIIDTGRSAINRVIHDKIYHAGVVMMLRARGYVIVTGELE